MYVRIPLAAFMLSLFGCVDELPPAAIERGFDMAPTSASGQAPGEVPDGQPPQQVSDAMAAPTDAVATDGAETPPTDAMVGDAARAVANPEVCDDTDNDLDGQIDEGFDVEASCSVGVGECEVSTGRLICDDEGGVVCAALEGDPQPELCNELDDDCDGQTDEIYETLVECTVGSGACLRGGLTLCDGPESTICSAVAGEPIDEVCNEQDDDCDGATDEDLGLGEPCNVGLGICQRAGEVVCGPNDGLQCSVSPGPQEVEMCNGLDDDCDGITDEGTNCGLYVQQNCRVWFGWSDDNEGPETPSDTWANCPEEDTSMAGNVRCVGTRRDGRFRTLTLPTSYYRMDYNDELAVAFTCDDDGSDMGAWLTTHCAVYLGHADYNRGPGDPSPTWADCPGELRDNEGNERCTSSAFDGRFHDMTTTGVINGDDDFGLAFRCADEASPERQRLAESVTREVEVLFAWAKSPDYTPEDGSESWPNCPGGEDERRRRANCVSSGGDGQFHRMDMESTVNGYENIDDEDAFGVAIRSRAE